MEADGLTTMASNYGPQETMDRLEAEIRARGLTVFARTVALSNANTLRAGPISTTQSNGSTWGPGWEPPTVPDTAVSGWRRWTDTAQESPEDIMNSPAASQVPEAISRDTSFGRGIFPAHRSPLRAGARYRGDGIVANFARRQGVDGPHFRVGWKQSASAVNFRFLARAEAAADFGRPTTIGMISA